MHARSYTRMHGCTHALTNAWTAIHIFLHTRAICMFIQTRAVRMFLYTRAVRTYLYACCTHVPTQACCHVFLHTSVVCTFLCVHCCTQLSTHACIAVCTFQHMRALLSACPYTRVHCCTYVHTYACCTHVPTHSCCTHVPALACMAVRSNSVYSSTCAGSSQWYWQRKRSFVFHPSVGHTALKVGNTNTIELNCNARELNRKDIKSSWRHSLMLMECKIFS